MADLTGTPSTAPAVTQGFVLTDAQFSALLAAAKGHAPLAAVATDAKAVGEDVIARMEQVVADAKSTINRVHGAAKSLQGDVKADWPLLLVGAIAVAGLVLHFVKVFGFGG